MNNKVNNKRFVINRVDLGQRTTGYEVFNAGVNGGEIVGMTTKQLKDAVAAGQVYGVLMDGEELVLDEAKGFHSIMVKTGIGTLTSTDPEAVANMVYTVYDRQGDNFKVVSSRFGRLNFCLDKIKALLDLGAVNGVVMQEDKVVCCWELESEQDSKKKGA